MLEFIDFLILKIQSPTSNVFFYKVEKMLFLTDIVGKKNKKLSLIFNSQT